ncbi:MAG: hypothetical protein QW165_02355 [Candidatus Woesearchaeota archaeon]
MVKDTKQSLESAMSNFLRKVAAPVAMAAGLAGCFNASGYYEATPEARARVRRVVEQQDYKATLEDVAKNHFSREAIETPICAEYVLPAVLDAAVDTAAKNGIFAATGPEVATYNSIKEQNKILNELVKSAGVRRTIVTDLQKNVQYDAVAFEQPSKSEIMQIEYNLRRLRTEVEKAPHEGRKALAEKLASNKDMQAMLKWNADALAAIAQLAIARADINHHEFYFNTIAENQLLAGAIHKSLTGIDIYTAGENVWQKKIANENVKDIIDPESPVGREYSNFGNKKVSELYTAIKDKIREEAADFGRHSKHTIGQFHYFHAKSILDQAHALNVLTDEELAAAEKYLTRDIASIINGNLPDEPSVSVLEHLASLLPVWQFYVAYRSAGPALSKDTAHYLAAAKILEDGAVQRYGAGTGYNRKGSTSADIVDLVLSTGSIAVEAGTTYLLLNKKSKDSGSSSATQSFGDDSISPGIGPR